MNFWNIKHPKQRLAILQKAEAQKRHLINLIKAKSVVADTSKSRSKLSNSLNRSLSKSSVKKDNSFASLQIQRNNSILYKKIVNTQKLQRQRLDRSNCKFINITKTLSQNHNMIYKVKKEMKQRQIDEENTKIFARLIQTSPTLKRTDWIRQNMQATKYKQNILRSKYAMPDYSVQACKLLSNQSERKHHFQTLKPSTGTSQLKYRNLNDSSWSNIKMRM